MADVLWKHTTPPSGITLYNGKLLPHLKGDLFVATLRSEALNDQAFPSI